MEQLTLKMVAEEFGFPIEKLGDLPIQVISIDAEIAEKIKTRNSKLTPWIEKYKCSQEATVSIKFRKNFPPEFYEENSNVK
jgi:hypothetical protein